MNFQVQWNRREYTLAQSVYYALHPRRTRFQIAENLLATVVFLLSIWILVADVQMPTGRHPWPDVSLTCLLAVWVLIKWRRRAGKRASNLPPIACVADAHGLRLDTDTYAWQDFISYEDYEMVLMLTRAGRAAPVLLPMARLGASEFAELLGLVRTHVRSADSPLGLRTANS